MTIQVQSKIVNQIIKVVFLQDFGYTSSKACPLNSEKGAR